MPTQRPSRLDADAELIYDALFTGGEKNTGIAGTNASGAMLEAVINDPNIAVEITFGPLSLVKGSADAYTDPNPLLNDGQNRIPIEVLVDHKPEKGTIFYVMRMSKLRISLNHELSHAHNFITKPKDFSTIGPPQRRQLETEAFRRDAALAWELSGGTDDWHVRASEFKYSVLQQQAAGNMKPFDTRLKELVGYAIK